MTHISSGRGTDVVNADVLEEDVRMNSRGHERSVVSVVLPISRSAWWAAVLLAALIVHGCAAFHPMQGVPAAYVPDQYLGSSRSGKKTIDLSLLVQRQPDQYRLGAGDIVAVYVPGVLGSLNVAEPGAIGETPPINLPQTADDPPTIGYPLTLRDDGTLSLPLVPPIHLQGLTLAEAEEAVRHAYTVHTDILHDDRDRILISLARRREYRVLVVRQVTSNELSAGAQPGTVNVASSKRGTAKLVRLPANENDVLHALAKAEGGADGLPGLDAKNTIYVIRRKAARAETPVPLTPMQPLPLGHSRFGSSPAAAPVAGHSTLIADAHRYASDLSDLDGYRDVWDGPWLDFDPTVDNPHIIKIPIRLAEGERPTFTEQDIILHDGDIVFIESRETEVFYTGGLLGGGQYTVPRDYDLGVLEAISIAQSPQTQQYHSTRAIGGVSALNMDVTFSASRVIILRQLANGTRMPIEVDLYKALRRPETENILIQPGDLVILQYTKLEALGAFIERHLLEGALFGVAAAQLSNNGG